MNVRTAVTGTVDGGDGLEPGEIHDVLRNERRRLVLRELRDGDGTETVRELSERIAGIESGESPPPRNVRQSVYVSLHQTHLPKLDDLGIVEYDADGKRVELAEHAPQVTVYLEVVPKYGLSWAELYLGLAFLGLVALLGAVFGVPVLVTLGPAVVAGTTLALVAAAATYQLFAQRRSVVHRHREEP